MNIKKMLLAACTAASLAVSFGASAANDSDIKWPDAQSAWLDKGAFVDVKQLRRMGPEMSKDQVRNLIGAPHFNEGFFNPRHWNYLFNFRTGNGSEYVTCQYQVVFDKKTLVESTHWRDPACAKYLENTPVAANTARPISVNSDGLFAFGRSSLNDLQPAGRAKLEKLVTQIKQDFSNVRGINIVGYTDRIGREASNLKLSMARANSVKQYLVSQGIDGGLIQTQGKGASNPVVFCPGAATPAVIACLMPNRRIEVSVNADEVSPK